MKRNWQHFSSILLIGQNARVTSVALPLTASVQLQHRWIVCKSTILLGISQETEKETYEAERSSGVLVHSRCCLHFACRLGWMQGEAGGRSGGSAASGQSDFRSGCLLFRGRASGVVSDRNGERIPSPVAIVRDRHCLFQTFSRTVPVIVALPQAASSTSALALATQ